MGRMASLLTLGAAVQKSKYLSHKGYKGLLSINNLRYPHDKFDYELL